MDPEQNNVVTLDEYARQILEQRIADAIDQVDLIREDDATDEKSVDEYSENTLQPAVNNAVNKVELNPGKFQFFLHYSGLQIGLLFEGTALLLSVCILFGLLFGIEPLLQLLATYFGR